MPESSRQSLAERIAVGEFRHRGLRFLRGRRMDRDLSYALVNGLHAAVSPLEHVRRKIEARAFRDNPRWSHRVRPEEGYAWIEPDEIPAVAEVVAVGQRLAAERKLTSRGKGKDFLRNILVDSDFNDYPAFLRLILSDPILTIASSYLGSLPRLQYFCLFHTPVNESTRSSQLFHRDGIDVRQMKFLFNIVDVDDGNGPFTFIPADISESIYHRSIDKWGRVEDTAISAVCRLEDTKVLRGCAGRGVAIDTSRCLHFGGRARDRERFLLIFNFANHYANEVRPLPVNRNLVTSSLHRRVLGLE